MEGVRSAKTADIGRCTELVAEAVAGIEGHRGAAQLVGSGGVRGDPAALVQAWMADPRAEVVLGTFEGVVVGIGVGAVVETDQRRHGRIECLYVEPGARAVGVGQRVVESLVSWFETQGCAGVDAVALPGDRSSKQLLEASGFKARLLILHRSLG